MNKTELTAAIVSKTGLTKKDAAASLDAVLDTIKTALAEGDSVAITGFGAFHVKERPERTGRNPSTGETMTIKATKVPVFKAGKDLKEAVK